MSAESVLGRADARAGMWVVGLFFLALLYVYHATALSMVAIWARSETFAHGFLILPISLWLIYIRWDEIATVRPQPNLFLSALLLPVGLVWLVAALVDVQVLQQLADAGYWEIEFNAWLDNPLMVDSRAREVQRVLDWVAGHVAKLPAPAPAPLK